MSALSLAIVSRSSKTLKVERNRTLTAAAYGNKIKTRPLSYTYVHSLPAFVVRYDDRWHVHHIDVDERFDAVGDRVVRMEDVVKFRAGRQNKILAQTIDATNRDEHG